MKASSILFAFLSMTITFGLVSPSPAYADPPKKDHMTGTTKEICSAAVAEGLYQVVILNKQTGEVVDVTIQYCPQGAPVPITEVAPDEIVVYRKVSITSNPLDEMTEDIYDLDNK